jgi:hypothetical protein
MIARCDIQFSRQLLNRAYVSIRHGMIARCDIQFSRQLFETCLRQLPIMTATMTISHRSLSKAPRGTCLIVKLGATAVGIALL